MFGQEWRQVGLLIAPCNKVFHWGVHQKVQILTVYTCELQLLQCVETHVLREHAKVSPVQKFETRLLKLTLAEAALYGT